MLNLRIEGNVFGSYAIKPVNFGNMKANSPSSGGSNSCYKKTGDAPGPGDLGYKARNTVTKKSCGNLNFFLKI